MKANAQKAKRQLAIAKGQLEGISKMIDQGAYCIDVSNQIMATIALLKNLNVAVLSAHLEGCVSDAARDGDEETLRKKIAEVESVLERLSH